MSSEALAGLLLILFFSFLLGNILIGHSDSLKADEALACAKRGGEIVTQYKGATVCVVPITILEDENG